MPSEAEPYSPEIDEGRVSVPFDVAEVPPAPSWNCCSTIGAAVSRPPLVLLQIVAPTEQETVLITRSPGVNDEMVPARAWPNEAWAITPIARTVIFDPIRDFPIASLPPDRKRSTTQAYGYRADAAKATVT